MKDTRFQEVELEAGRQVHLHDAQAQPGTLLCGNGYQHVLLFDATSEKKMCVQCRYFYKKIHPEEQDQLVEERQDVSVV